jgi:hypothetical protein
MAQLSRPYQIALGAMAVLALVWFVALHGHKGNPSEPSAPSISSKPSTPGASSKPSASSSSAAAAQERAAAKATPVYHGAAPGVEGLTRDISKAHGAVALSQQKASELQRKSVQASNEASPSKGASGSTAASGGHAGNRVSANHPRSVPTSHPGSMPTSHPGSMPTSHPGSGTDASAPATPKRPVQQATVERELTHGKTVLLVFWNPKASVDASVRSQAIAVGHGSKGRVAVHVARAGQVGLFGPVTEVAHVYQTPTILIVGRHGLVSVLTGLIDDFGLRQAVGEAEHANK